MAFKSQVDKHTMVPLDELEPATKSWCQSHGVNVDTVSEILQKKPKEVTTESIRIRLVRRPCFSNSNQARCNEDFTPFSLETEI